MADTVGMKDIRGLNITKAVTGFALINYVFKDRLCLVQTSSKWTERYYEETAADLTGHGDIEGVPRLATFPHDEVSWTKKESDHKKFGEEGRISHEDEISNDVDVIARSLLRLARGVVKRVDTNIWNVITEGQPTGATTNINDYDITAGDEWDSATIANRDPIQDILNAKKLIAEQNYNPEGAFLCLSPKDYANLLGNANVRNAGQFFTDSVTRRGMVGTILGLTILVSNNVTADFAAIVIGREAATWKTLEPLKVVSIIDEGIGRTIRAWEIGVCQLKNPKAVCLMHNTQK